MKYGWRRGNTTYFEDLQFEKLLSQTLRGARRPCEEAGPYSDFVVAQGDRVREQLTYLFGSRG